MDQAARRGDLRRLIRAAEWKLRRSPGDPLLHLDLGRKYFAGGRVEEALPHLEASLDDPRALAAAHYYLARCRMTQGAYEAAIEHLRLARSAAVHERFRGEITFHLVRCLQEEGLHEEARRVRDGDRPDP